MSDETGQPKSPFPTPPLCPECPYRAGSSSVGGRDPYPTGFAPLGGDPFATGSPVPDPAATGAPAVGRDPHPTGTPTATHIPAPEPSSVYPRRFGDNYELLERIARTNMSIVWKARQIRANRLAAVKLIQGGHLATPEQVARFHREAQSAADLRHPGIVTIYDVGEVDGQHYFAMEWLEGGSLKELLVDGPLPPRLAAELLLQAAEAVAHAHERGVIHRDIKPHNILLVSRTGRPADSSQNQDGSSTPSGSSASAGNVADLPVVKLADFGLARVKEASDLSRTGEVMGTPSYMPPEQARGEMKKIGPWSDVYGLGAVLYQLLTGRPPFQSASEHETLRQVREEEPVPPRLINQSVPRDLENICLKCLAKEENRRYQTAGELAEELGRYLRGEPVQARAVSVLERGWCWCGRNRMVAGLMAAVALVLVGGIAVSSSFAFTAGLAATTAKEKEDEAKREAKEAKEQKNRADAKAKEAEDQRIRANAKAKEAKDQEDIAKANAKEAGDQKNRANAKAKEAEDQRIRADKQLDIAELRLYGSTLNQAQQEWRENNGIRALELLDSCQWNLRNIEFRHLWTLYNSNQTTWRGHIGKITCVAISPDGKRIVSGSWDKTLKVWHGQLYKNLR